MSIIINAVNAAFASAKVKDYKITFNKPEALTFIEVERNGQLIRHGLDITIGRFLEPSPGHVQVVVWKAMEKLVARDQLGTLKYVNFNGTLFSVDN